MYNSFDPYIYQPYNDPQPEHYASSIPQGMPQPSRPSAFASTEPAYPYYGSNNNTYDSQQPYGAYGTQTPNYYPSNPTPAPAEDPYIAPYAQSTSHHYPPSAPQASPSLSHTGSHQYPPPPSTPELSHASSHHYPPSAPTDFYPAVSSAGYSSAHSEAPVESGWGLSYPPRKDQVQQEERLQSHAGPKRDEKENISFSVDEAQSIIKQLKESNKSLTLQLSNSRDSTNKVTHEKDALIEQLRKEIEAVRSLQAQAVDPKEAVAAVEREWTQRIASKEQEILARAQVDAEAMAQKHTKSQEENATLLARVSKLQADSDSGRAFLLETNAALEAEVAKLQEGTKQQDAEILKLKDETENQEAELIKLREELSMRLDEVSHMEDEKENALASIKQLEDEKLELEAQLKDQSAGYMAESNAIAAEKSNLMRRIESLDQELEKSLDLCEQRRVRIESLEKEEVPILNSKIELLEEKLEDAGHTVDGLEKQLDEVQKREMENGLRVAGESRLATEEIQKLRYELDEHMLGKSENARSLSELQSEKLILDQRVARVDVEKTELEKSLKEVSDAKKALEEESGIIRDALDRETQENEEAQAEQRSKIAILEEHVSTLSTAKIALETRHSESEARNHETERLLHATEDMLKVLKEEVEQKRELETTSNEAKVLSDVEKEELCSRVKSLEKGIEEMRYALADKEDALEAIQEELISKQRLEREIRGLKYDLDKANKEIDLLKREVEDLTIHSREADDRIYELEEDRSQMDARAAALLEDQKRGVVKCSELGEEINKLETENKELNRTFSDMNSKYCLVVVERDELVQENRNLRKR